VAGVDPPALAPERGSSPSATSRRRLTGAPVRGGEPVRPDSARM